MNALVQQAPPRSSREWSPVVVDYVFAGSKVWRTEFDVITCERTGGVLVASCVTQGSALAAWRLMRGEP